MRVEGCLLSWPFSTFPSYRAAINYILVLVATNTNSWWLNCAEKEKTPDINLAMTSSLDTALLVLGAQLGMAAEPQYLSLWVVHLGSTKGTNPASLGLQLGVKQAQLLHGERRSSRGSADVRWSIQPQQFHRVPCKGIPVEHQVRQPKTTLQ